MATIRDKMGHCGFRAGTEDHRLEGGGFGSRLKARLLLEPEKTGDLNSFAPPTSSVSLGLYCEPSPV
jgi:hypothetical protein